MLSSTMKVVEKVKQWYEKHFCDTELEQTCKVLDNVESANLASLGFSYKNLDECKLVFGNNSTLTHRLVLEMTDTMRDLIGGERSFRKKYPTFPTSSRFAGELICLMVAYPHELTSKTVLEIGKYINNIDDDSKCVLVRYLIENQIIPNELKTELTLKGLIEC